MAKIEIIKQIIGAKISPCPFCSSAEVEIIQSEGCCTGHYYDLAYAHCICCGSEGPNVDNEDGLLSGEEIVLLAVEKWNNRA